MRRDFELTKFVIKENSKLRKRIEKLEEIISEMGNFKKVLTPKEIEIEYGISLKTLGRYRIEWLEYMQPKTNGKILIKRNDLEKFLKRN